MSDPIPSAEPEYDSDKMDRLRTYAWSYFSFHAEQRITTFNFYLIIVGAIAAGLISLQTATEGKSAILEGLLCFLVTFISIMFYLLDGRSRQLVENGEKALAYLDTKEKYDRAGKGVPHVLEIIARDNYQKSEKIKKRSWRALYSYSVVFGTLFFVFGLLGVIVGGFYFHKGLPGLSFHL